MIGGRGRRVLSATRMGTGGARRGERHGFQTRPDASAPPAGKASWAQLARRHWIRVPGDATSPVTRLLVAGLGDLWLSPGRVG